MDEATIWRVFNDESWSDKKLTEAARGLVMGSCNDPPDITFAFWLNLARDQAKRLGQTVEEAELEVLEQAKKGIFG